MKERAKSRSAAIDGIRGMAALALMTVHVGMFSGLLGTKALGTPRPPSNFFGGFLVSGLPSFIGVFFVLPAMYLYLPLAKAIISGEKRPPQRGNFVRRLMRLLPAYYLMCLVSMLALNRNAIEDIWFFLRPFLLVQVYLPTPFTPKLMNGMEVTWTVPSMVQWYIALPLIAWAVHKFAARGATPAQRARRLMLPVPVLIVAGIGWLLFVKGNGWDNRIVFWWPLGFAPTMGIGMGLAILLALAKVSPNDMPKLFLLARQRPYLFWLGALAVYLVNCARPFSVIGMDAIYSTSGLLVTYLMVAAFGFFATVPLVAPGARATAVDFVLSRRPLVHIGRVSYGIYLWHFAVMHFYLQPGSVLTGDTRPIREMYAKAGFWELELVTFTGSLLLATLSFYLLEQPIGAWADRWITRLSASTAQASLPRWQRQALTAQANSTAMPLDDAATAAVGASSDRDAIRANLIDLERSFGRQLLSGPEVTGESQARWAAASADLTAMWELFTAYSQVVDEATQVLNGSRHPSAADLVKVTTLLNGQSVELTGPPPPLAQRHITDSGRSRLTPAAAIEQMNQLFNKTVELVTLAEQTWHESSAALHQLRIDAERLPDNDFEAELTRLQELLTTDPLTVAAPIAQLRKDIDAAAATLAAHT